MRTRQLCREVAMDRLRRIEMLVGAADAGTFAKAAEVLDLTPSAVSHSIAQLEKELRITLFYRTTRQLRLTEDGEELYRRIWDNARAPFYAAAKGDDFIGVQTYNLSRTGPQECTASTEKNTRSCSPAVSTLKFKREPSQ